MEVESIPQMCSIIQESTETLCLFFYSAKSQQCKALWMFLSEICAERNITTLKLNVKNKDMYNIVSKHASGILPRYIFIKQNRILGEFTGFVPKKEIERNIERIKEANGAEVFIQSDG